MLKAELEKEVERLNAENAELRARLDSAPTLSDDYRLSVLADGEILYIALTNAVTAQQLGYVPSDSWVGDGAFINERLGLYLNGKRYARKLVGIEGGLIDSLVSLEGVIDAEHLQDAEIDIMP